MTKKYFQVEVEGVMVLRSPPNPRREHRNKRGKYHYGNAPSQVEPVRPPHVHKYKPPSKPYTDHRYRVHVIRNVGAQDGSQIWIPLGTFKHLSSAYKKVTNLRAHFNKHHTNHAVLRDYTIFIEFRGSGYVRAFNLTPEYSLNSARIASTPGMGSSFTTSWYTPKSWIMHEMYKKSKTKKRKGTPVPQATAVPITAVSSPKTRPEKGKSKKKTKPSSKRSKQRKGGCSLPALVVPADAVKDMPPTIRDMFKNVVRYFQALVPR